MAILGKGGGGKGAQRGDPPSPHLWANIIKACKSINILVTPLNLRTGYCWQARKMPVGLSLLTPRHTSKRFPAEAHDKSDHK